MVAAMAGRPRVREQHLAVFGGSGSGKTVLVSSFYGAAQEPGFLSESLYDLIADDTGQGNRLRQNYLGMKNRAQAPEATRFASTSYAFTIKLKNPSDPGTARTSGPFDALRVVWHDYPGEWFEEEPSSDEEARRRLGTFRRLLRSNVALILVDGQKLADYSGEEEKYLKSMLGNLRDGLLRFKDDLLDNGKPLVEFPRIWVLALSKADLHPDRDVHWFHDLVVEKAAGDVAALHDVLKGMVQVPGALSMGEDYLLLSSAKFEPDRIEVTERLGMGLLLPVACLLPLERLIQWADRIELPRKWLGQLAENADAFAEVLVGTTVFRKVIAKIPKWGRLANAGILALARAIKFSAPKIKEVNAKARTEKDYLTAVVSQFQLDLDQGVKDDLLVKSRR